MTKTNLTIQLDTDVIRKAKVLAARRGTSVSALVARELHALIARDERYDDAQKRAVALMATAKPRGGRAWTRDRSLCKRVDRHAR